MKLYRTTSGVFVEEREQHFPVSDHTWDALLAREDLPEFLTEFVARAQPSNDFHRCRAAGADQPAGGVGCRRNLLSQPRRAHGGIKGRRRR